MLAATLLVILSIRLLRKDRAPGPAAPAEPPLSSPSTRGAQALVDGTRAPGTLAPREVAAKVMPSVVVLRCRQAAGSGFFVTEHRILTNEHVTCGLDETIAIELADGTKGEGRAVAVDERLDLALVETVLSGVPLPTSSAGDLASGDTVMAAGAPMGLERTFHVGTLSNPRRIMVGVCYLQVNAGINAGNSGGPLLDSKGQAVAVVSMKREQAEGIAFAVPIDYAFDGGRPLLPPPAWHPTPGFASMLEDARRDDERLVDESMRLRMQVVRAVPVGRAHVLAVVLAANSSEPEQKLSFRFEQAEDTICNVTGVITWRENNPDKGLAKRASQWMIQMGIGKVYSGTADLDARACQFEKGIPIDLVLEDGDESLNRVTL